MTTKANLKGQARVIPIAQGTKCTVCTIWEDPKLRVFGGENLIKQSFISLAYLMTKEAHLKVHTR